MGLLVVEILLAGYALSRGWRKAPALLVAIPLLTLGFESTFAGLLGPWIGAYFDPAGTARALAHACSLVGLAVACWTDPSEQPTAGRTLGRPARRRMGPLYQI